MTTINIESLIQWSPAKRVETRQGPRMLQTGSPTDRFWDAWRSGKDRLKSAGVSCKKDENGWQVAWWRPLDAATRQAEQQAVAASRATDSDAVIPCPAGLEYLPFQKAGIAFADGKPAVLIADEMGLGKTIQAVGISNTDATIKRVLVVCPASLRLNWKREWLKWTTRPMSVGVVTGGKAADWPAGHDVVVINYDVVAKHRSRIDAVQWDLLVADEAHYMKSPDAIRTKNVLGHKPRNKNGKPIAPIQARRRVFLTGTPIENRPVELWPLVQALDPQDLGRSFFGYAKRYCAAHQGRWGWDFTGASHLDELRTKLRTRFMVRRLKSEVLTELPPKRYQVIAIPANGASGVVAEELRQYETHRSWIESLEEKLADMERELEAGLLDEDELADVRRELAEAKKVAFTEMSRIRHEVGLAKIPAVKEYIQTCLESEPLVVFAHHQDVVAGLAEASDKSVTITGQTKLEDRQAAVDAFQAGESDLFVGNLQAAGVGITLTRASHVVAAELDWRPSVMSQAVDRLHRIGQRESVLVTYLVFEGSLDERMAELLIKKQQVIDKALDAGQVNYGGDDVTEVDVEIKPDPVRKQGEAIPAEQVAAIHECLRILAGVCDGARKRDDCGFNGTDSAFGRSLAYQVSLSPRQAAIGLKIVPKYHRQLPAELLAKAKGQER